MEDISSSLKNSMIAKLSNGKID